jgi:hypothetical protein
MVCLRWLALPVRRLSSKGGLSENLSVVLPQATKARHVGVTSDELQGTYKPLTKYA